MSKTNITKVKKPVFDDNLKEGIFSNSVSISLSQREVFLDFKLIGPDEKNVNNLKQKTITRIILTKEHALEFKNVLSKTLKHYEEKGDI